MINSTANFLPALFTVAVPLSFAQEPTPWLLTNFSNRLEVQVSGPTGEVRIGPLGLALYFDPDTVSSVGTLTTKDANNDVAIFRARLEPGHAVTGRYWMTAAWSGSGIHDLLGHLSGIEHEARASVVISNFSHTKTPMPNRLEGEAY